MIRHIPASLGELMNRRGVEVIHDRGRFADRNAVAVNGETLEAKHIVIATGSKPRKLPFPGAELMITSDDVLSEGRLPADVVFVGGGVITLEFSHVYARAGARVTILEALPRLLDNMNRAPSSKPCWNAVFASMGSIPSSSIGSATASPWPAPRMTGATLTCWATACAPIGTPFGVCRMTSPCL